MSVASPTPLANSSVDSNAGVSDAAVAGGSEDALGVGREHAAALHVLRQDVIGSLRRLDHRRAAFHAERLTSG